MGRARSLVFSNLRFLAQCCLLGAVVAGILTGWHDEPAVDYHTIGAIAGGLVGTAIKILHVL